MKVVVTGGSGFIGTHLVRALLRQGHEVVILDRTRSREFPELSTIADLTQPAEVGERLPDCDAVYHLAAEHRDDVAPVGRYYEVNVEGTRHVARVAALRGAHRFVFTSTAAVYDLGNNLADETTKPSCHHPYAASKLEAERLLAAWPEEGSGRSLFIVRPAAVFGPGGGGNVRNLIDQIRRGRFLMVGSGRNRKSICYVENLAAFLVWTLEFRGKSLLVNYADGPDLRVRELVQQIREQLGLPEAAKPSVPYALALCGGYLLDLLSMMSGRSFVIQSQRVRKFCSDTQISVELLERLPFRRPYTLTEGLGRTLDFDRSPDHGDLPVPEGAQAQETVELGITVS